MRAGDVMQLAGFWGDLLSDNKPRTLNESHVSPSDSPKNFFEFFSLHR